MSTQQTKFTAIADAIRAKKGTTDGIVANDFASEIASIEVGRSSSQFYLNKCVLTVDEGYRIERIPINSGDEIDLGDGEDVAASTGWDDETYHTKSHPAMTFQSWSSSVVITDNQFTVPDDICTDYYVRAIYKSADDVNYLVKFTQVSGFEVETFEDSEVTTVYTSSTYGSNIFTSQVIAVWLGGSITSIGANTFRDCHSLIFINIPSGIISVGNYAFYNCYSLALTNMPCSVTSIGTDTFSYCYSLASANIPSSVTSIGANAYRNCYSITSVNIPSSVTSVGTNIFNACYSLALVNIPSSVTSIESYVFYNCYSLASANILSSMTSIEDYAFCNCYSITSVNIPSSVTGVGIYAFSNCYSLASVVLNSVTPPTLSDVNAFNNSNATFLVPEDSLDAYKEATNWASFADNIIANTEENRIKFGLI